MIIESILTTMARDGTINFAPMGVEWGDATIIIKPFLETTTFRNVRDTGTAVVNLVDDVMALSRYGVVGNLKGYFTFFSEQERPEDIIKGVANKDVDIAIVWGPLAGYFTKQLAAPLTLTPLPAKDSLSDIPFQYNMSSRGTWITTARKSSGRWVRTAPISSPPFEPPATARRSGRV